MNVLRALSTTDANCRKDVITLQSKKKQKPHIHVLKSFAYIFKEESLSSKNLLLDMYINHLKVFLVSFQKLYIVLHVNIICKLQL